jgi:hypothetical protein
MFKNPPPVRVRIKRILVLLGIALCKTKQNWALKPRSSLQGRQNGSCTSLIKLAEVFVDDEVDVFTSQFPQLTLVSR